MIDGSQFLKELRSGNSHLALLIQNIIDGINGVAQHLGVDPTGKVAPPDPPKAINVKAGSDHVHVTVDDEAPVRKGIEYFVEYSVNDSTFANPHVEHLGTSRGRPLALPAKDDSGTPVNYFFQAYSSYRGSDPSQRVVFGGQTTATAVQLTGSSRLTLLPSKGSGTAPADGSRGGQGFGTDLQRLPVGPKVPAAQRIF